MTSLSCRVCSKQNLEQVLDLGNQPWCNNFLTAEQVGTEPIYPLNLVYCHDCGTVQLDYTVPKEVMFGDHTYLSGITKSLNSHFKDIASESTSLIFHTFTRNRTHGTENLLFFCDVDCFIS